MFDLGSDRAGAGFFAGDNAVGVHTCDGGTAALKGGQAAIRGDGN